MKKLSLFFILIFLGSSTVFCTETMRLTTLEWNPYAGSKLPNYGFSSEIISKSFQEMGIKVTIHFHPWNRAMRYTAEGKYNGLFSAYHTDERAKKYIYSNSYVESIIALFKQKDTDITYTKLEDLKKYRIGITNGFANTPEFDAADFLTKVPAETEVKSLQNLVNGHVDLIVMDKYRCLDLLSRYFPEQKNSIEALSNTLQKKPLYLIFSKKNRQSEKHATIFNQGLQRIKEKGLYNLILGRHKFIPEKTIFIGTLEWAPYASQHMEKYGFISEIIQKTYNKVGYKTNITFRPWARILFETDKGLYDVAFPSYYSKERDEKYSLVNLNIKSQVGFMKLKKVKLKKYTSLIDLKPYSIGIVHGYVNRPDFDKANFLRKKRVYSDESNIKNLIAGNLNLIVIDKMVASYLMKKFPKVEYDFLDPLLDEKELYLAFSKNAPNYRIKITAFQYGLQEIINEGEFDKIIKNHSQ